MKPEEMPESFFAGLRAQLHDIYRNADLVADYLVNREYRSRGPLPAYDCISVSDVRMEPQALWVNVYYTLYFNGHRSRECLPIMWDLFRKIVNSENTGKSRKDPFSMETKISNDYPKVPPVETGYPRVRRMSLDEVQAEFKTQERDFNNGWEVFNDKEGQPV